MWGRDGKYDDYQFLLPSCLQKINATLRDLRQVSTKACEAKGLCSLQYVKQMGMITKTDLHLLSDPNSFSLPRQHCAAAWRWGPWGGQDVCAAVNLVGLQGLQSPRWDRLPVPEQDGVGDRFYKTHVSWGLECQPGLEHELIGL